MSHLERNWQYTEQFPNETESQVRARRLSLELGIEPVSRAISASLSQLVVATAAQTICEVGTGVGVSGLALLRHAPEATLTSIEIEREHLRQAREVFASAEIAPSRLRLIEDDAKHVMPRLNNGAYDMTVLDADHSQLLEHLEFALLITRKGGTIAIPSALLGGRVANPAARDHETRTMRDLLATVGESQAIAAALSPVGDGLLLLTKLDG